MEHVDSILDPVEDDLGEIQRKVVRTLGELADEGGGVSEDDLLARLVPSEAAPPEGVRDRRREKYQRSIRTLVERSVVISENDLLRLDDGSPF